MNSGAPGGGGQINLRGVTTINAGVDPLIVLDGMVIATMRSQQHERDHGSGGGRQCVESGQPVNRLADINPADIQSIEVLKGASARRSTGRRRRTA